MIDAPADDDGDLRRLAVDVETLFVHTDAGRIRCTNSPDRSPAPRLFLAGCAGGNILRLRHDVSDEIAASAARLVQAEPAWPNPQAVPDCLAALRALLGAEEALTPALIYHLPHSAQFDTAAQIIDSETPQGAALLARLAEHGMPPALAEAGFVDTREFWPPWCVAMVDEEIASMAFAARLGERGAEVGVYTFPGFRGRGLAAAVTANWSRLASLRRLMLFYSTHTTNLASQSVTHRLGLRRFGVSVSVE